jgi:hypothetical protein
VERTVFSKEKVGLLFVFVSVCVCSKHHHKELQMHHMVLLGKLEAQEWSSLKFLFKKVISSNMAAILLSVSFLASIMLEAVQIWEY